jgi:hypothetical protein
LGRRRNTSLSEEAMKDDDQVLLDLRLFRGKHIGREEFSELRVSRGFA